MVRNTLYKGEYRDVKNFCVPIIDEYRFDKIQTLHKIIVRDNQSNRVYIFSGLLRCPQCHSKLTGNTSKRKNGKEYKYYRCSKGHLGQVCDCDRVISEEKLESFLLDNLQRVYMKYTSKIITVKKIVAVTDYSKQINSIKSKLSKLKDMYLDDIIDKEEYIRTYHDLDNKLKDFQKKSNIKKDNQPKTINRQIISKQFIDIYNTLNIENKLSAWKEILEYIEIDYDDINNCRIIFKEVL